MQVYNLEYELLDSIGRAKKTMHYGVFGTLEQLEEAKQSILKQQKESQVRFNVHVIENLFSKISQS